MALIQLFHIQQLNADIIFNIKPYMYREINREVARKQHEVMQRAIIRARKDGYLHEQKLNMKVIKRRMTSVFHVANIFIDPALGVKDGYIMFKCMQLNVDDDDDCDDELKKYINRSRLYTKKQLRGMLGMNKVKGRSKLKTKREMIVALMKM